MVKPSKETLINLYIDQSMTMKEVASAIGISVGSVHKLLHEYGIPTRQGGLAYGSHLSDEAKQRISQKTKGRRLSEESRRKLSEASKVGGIGHKKMRTDGYIYIYFPDHPKSSSDGYIMEHVLIMECAIGRWLEDNEVVHHINHIRSDNRLVNLQLMTKSEHMRLHTTERHRSGGIPCKTTAVENVETGEVFQSIRDAAKKYGAKPSSISRVCNGKRKHTAGYTWKYHEKGCEDLSISQH